MKLGELFFEQVLIGLLMFAGLVLPFAPDLMSAKLADVNTMLGVAGGALILAVAFVLGLVFDRVADSLADRLDTHNRLCYALRQKKTRQPDPYPEDAYRITVLKFEKDVVMWMNYHRSRIRVARALMVYGPALAMAAVVGTAALAVPNDMSSSLAWLLVVPLAYVAAGWVLAARKKLPKTYDNLNDYATVHRNLISPRDHRGAAGAAWILLKEPLVLAETVVSLIALALALATRSVGPIVTGVALVALTVLSAWTWWRISTTYRAYLQKAAESESGEAIGQRAA